MTSGRSATISSSTRSALLAICLAACASGGSTPVTQPDLPPCAPALVVVAPSNWSYEDALAALTELGWLNSSLTGVQLPERPEVSKRRETGRALLRSYAAKIGSNCPCAAHKAEAN